MSDMLPMPKLSQDDIYPHRDGEPMAESELHVGEMIYARDSLEIWLETGQMPMFPPIPFSITAKAIPPPWSLRTTMWCSDRTKSCGR